MTNHNQYAARLGNQYLCEGSAQGNLILSSKTKDAKTFPDYISARNWALSIGGDNTVSLDRHGLAGIVDQW